MTADFTISKYAELCTSMLISDYRILTFSEYIEGKGDNHDRFIILRHDVDRKPFQSLKMAKLERKLGIQSTYYFRYPFTFLPNILREVRDLGHEIGYHYEVLSKTNGDFDKAIKLFNYELTKFREICDIKTICMHGQPISKYDNKAIWDHYDFADFGLKGEGYLSISKDIDYFSDTGRSWSGKNSLRDFLPGKEPRFAIADTDQLIRFLKDKKACKIYILSHPERWASNKLEWCQSYLQDLVFNSGKRALGVIRG